MTTSTLEDVYAALADGIDAAGPHREALFLSKVVLLLANALNDPDTALALVREGLDGLDGMTIGRSAVPPRAETHLPGATGKGS